MSEKLLCPHCENDLADPCIWCREESLKARVEELEAENHELKTRYVCGVPWIDHEEEKRELQQELADLRRKVGEWADDLEWLKSQREVVAEMREEAGKS